MCSLTHISLKHFCIFLKPNVLCNSLRNVDNKQNQINEAAVKVIFTVEKKESLYNEVEICFSTSFFISKQCIFGPK